MLADPPRRRGCGVALAFMLTLVAGCDPSPTAGVPREAPSARAAATPEPGVLGEPQLEPQPESDLARQTPDILEVGRWSGRVTERHAEFVRYRFESPDEPDTLVELSPRRPQHGQAAGTDTLAIQPAPGGQTNAELYGALTAWLRAPPPPTKPASPVVERPALQTSEPERQAEDPRVEQLDALRKLGLGLGCLWLLALLGSLGSSWHRPQDSELTERPWRAFGLALVVALAAIGLRLALAAPAPIGDDALRDIGAGMSCVLDQCPEGAPASFGRVQHGTGYPRLLGLCFELGLGLRSVQFMLTLFAGLAVGLCFDAGRRLGGPRLGIYVGALAALAELALLLTELSVTGEVLWHPAAAALPVALTQVALCHGAATGRAGAILLAGLAAGLAFEAHVSGLVLWPGLLIVTIAASQAPPTHASNLRKLGQRLLWLPTCAGALATPLILSPSSVLNNGTRIGERLGTLGVLAGAGACVLVSLAARRWCSRAQSKDAHSWRASALALATPLVLLFTALALTTGFVESRPIRYFALVFPALALSGAWLAGLALGRLEHMRARVVASALLAGALAWACLPAYLARMRVDRDRWNHADVETIAAVLREAGVARSELHLAVRGGLCGESSHGARGQRLHELLFGGLHLLGRLEAVSPREEAPVPVWFVAKFRTLALPELPASALTLPSGAEHTIVMAPYEPLLDLAKAQLCAGYANGERRCVSTSPLPPSRSRRQVMPRHKLPDRELELRTLDYEFPLHVASTTRSGSVELTSLYGVSPWHFADPRADTHAPPASRVELRIEAGAKAILTLAHALDGSEFSTPWWPPLIELPEDPLLQAAFGHSSPGQPAALQIEVAAPDHRSEPSPPAGAGLE